jgi:2-dehydro-3-deoxyphosphogluconate aldolase/(4S)-4-hydroxy-2-oxoglutarate aldolase
MTSLMDQLTQQRLLAIIRGRDLQGCVDTALTLVDEGVGLLEISLTSADALQAIELVAARIGGDVALGAGTLLTAQDVRQAREAGATFAVTPAYGPAAAAAVEAGMPLLAGALTPSEVVASINAGADAIKVFPASAFGPGYLASLRDPFPDVPFVPVGGVGAQEVPEYLRRGAVAVGVGSPLCGDAPHGGDLASLRERARQYLAAVAPTQPGLP